MPLSTVFFDELMGMIEHSDIKARIDRLWLGGTAGPSGGQGVRPGGYIGQLIQTLVAYDTSEIATPIGSGSLWDNLNHIRHRIAVISGLLNSGIAGEITVREFDGSPTVSGVRIITFSGARVIDNGNNEVIIEIIGGSGGSGSNTFLGLTDTPDTYVGQGSKYVTVKSNEMGLEFNTSSAIDSAARKLALVGW